MALFKISFGTNKQPVKKPNDNKPLFADSSSIDDEERKYYQPDDYYVFVAHPGTPFEEEVVPFDERCKRSYASKRGLYVAEILLLHYCSLGKYPKPKGGYPGFWWFKYGIRDVGHALSSLADKGYLVLSAGENSLKDLTVSDLKKLADEYNIKVSGKKPDIIKSIVESVNFEDIVNAKDLKKYSLTEKGIAELEENAYVPYMHNHSYKTTEDDRFGETFTVWDINKLLHDKDISQWRSIVGEIERKRLGVNIACGKENSQNKKGSGKEQKYSTEEMRQYLKDNKERIRKEAHSASDGFEEEIKGIEFRKLGEDKKALFNFYVSISKGFDAPALYKETMMLLRKYDMFEEELAVCKVAMRAVPDSNKHKEELQKRMEKIQKLIEKNK